MKGTSELDLFISYNSQRNKIIDFFNIKTKNIYNPNTLIEVGFGLFSLSTQLDINQFKAQNKLIVSNHWLKKSKSPDNIIFYNNSYIKKHIPSNIFFSMNSWYANKDLNINELKQLISEQINIKNKKHLEVIANTVKYTYNLGLFDKTIIVSEQCDISMILNNIYVGDIIIVPLSKKNNRLIHENMNALMKRGASIILLEPIECFKEEVEKENQMIFSDTTIPFRVVYYSLF